jgi:hypothetical protein
MQVPLDDITLEEIDEALAYLRNKLQDRYGNRLTYQQREYYLANVDELLDARLFFTRGHNGNREGTNLHAGVGPE